MGEPGETIEHDEIAALLADDFSGVVSVRSGSKRTVVVQGFADRATGMVIEAGTRFGCASAAKTFTALVALRAIKAGALELDTLVARLVPEHPQLHPEVTVRHLLEHTSGIGDYLAEDDEIDIESVVLPVPVAELDTPAAVLPMLDLAPHAEPGEPFRYNNGGYVLLAVVAERAEGRSHYDQAQDIFDAAAMSDSGFFRSDQLPENTALGYLESGATNIDNLPVRGNGDGGVYLTVGDVDRFWDALRDGRLLPAELRDQMTTPRHDAGSDGHYGWGLWLNAEGSAWSMEGMDAGVSFRSTHAPAKALTLTVVSNTTSGAWPALRAIGPLVGLG